MKKKECSLCKKTLPINSFYKSAGYKGGYTRRCKNCVKSKARERELKIRSDADGLEKDRARHREKYYKYNYKEKHKPNAEDKRRAIEKYRDKYPEKIFARNKSSHIKSKEKGNHLHHWSYKIEHCKDVIELKPEDHYTAHRYIIYDQERMMYRTKEGLLLDTKQRHEAYLKELGIKLIL